MSDEAKAEKVEPKKAEPERVAQEPAPAKEAPSRETQDSDFAVFDLPVNDAPNARPRAARPTGGVVPPPAARTGSTRAPGTRPRGRKVEAEIVPPEEDPTYQYRLDKARDYVEDFELLVRASVRMRYRGVLKKESIDEIDQRLRLDEREVEKIARPAAEGLRHVDVPWYFDLAMAGVAVWAPRFAFLSKLDEQIQRDRPRKEPRTPAEAAASSTEKGG